MFTRPERLEHSLIENTILYDGFFYRDPDSAPLNLEDRPEPLINRSVVADLWLRLGVASFGNDVVSDETTINSPVTLAT